MIVSLHHSEAKNFEKQYDIRKFNEILTLINHFQVARLIQLLIKVSWIAWGASLG